MKKIIIGLAVLTLLFASALTAYRIQPVRDAVADILPLGLKTKIKRTIFTSSALREDVAALHQNLVERDKHIADLNTVLVKEKDRALKLEDQMTFADLSGGAHSTWPKLAHAYSYSVNNLFVESAGVTTIKASDGAEYLLTQFGLPFLPTALGYGYKPLFFVDSTASDLYMITGDGVVFKTNKKELDKKQIKLTSVPSNIRSVITDKAIFEASWFSVKDLKILNERAYISYNKKVGKDYTLAILSADLGQSPLVFEEFFSLSDPISIRDPFNAHQVGGRIVEFTDNQLLISTGDYRKYEKAQDENSLLGKIFAIDIDTKATRIISKGHRNAQGLEFNQASGTIVSTEHGPFGGDEINLNHLGSELDSKTIKNFGWPMASYGKHYDSRFHEDAPLHKSHSAHGFVEPLVNFTTSIGISQLVRVPNSFAPGFSNDYFAGSMGLNPAVPIFSIHHFRLNQANNAIIHQATIKIGERIRDISVLDQTRLMLALEGNNTPAIGILQSIKSNN
jgi:hypothetical protein